MNEEQYAKAQRAYYGRPKGAAAQQQDAFNATFFDPNSVEGRERTKLFNSRAAYMRRQRSRMGFDGPPWKVHAAEGATQSQARAAGAAGPRWQSLRLAFQCQRRHIADELAKLRAEVRQYKGFAGLDGSRYDSAASTARAQHKIHQHPTLRQYILMTERAKERVQVDRAVGDIIFYVLYVILGLAIVLLTREIYQSYHARKAYIELKEQEIMEGRLRG
ncbi:hypothetical protein STCU_05182 [Strigomonas culicis]|uniref:Uncharacterized protein n=1 Tax=Strigomonas culicis TaxID=28005 RepID=S9VMH1_9TRYP|nr:hypothetical protein STCU_05182 [Strigomonas culicis]|eukprot:EPY28336.1 hypothetical protein STCU_05182 [Strigomonas culicis]